MGGGIPGRRPRKATTPTTLVPLLRITTLAAMLVMAGVWGGDNGSHGKTSAESVDVGSTHAASVSGDTGAHHTETDSNGADPRADTSNAHDSTLTNETIPARPPKIEQWEKNMVEYGHRWGKALQDETEYLRKFKLLYYDAQRVHEQIGEYLGEAQPWRDYGQKAESTYKRYLEKSGFRALGYQRFPHGLYLDWKHAGDNESRKYLELLRDRPPFSWPEGKEDSWARQKYSREVAYSIQSQIIAERAGYPRQRDRLSSLVDLALGHIDIWVTKDYIDSNPDWQFCQAFMAGLTASALIEYYQQQVERDTPDSRILPAIERLAGFLWDEMWVTNVDGSGYGAFEHVQPSTRGVGSESPSPDLSLLIAPMYSWLYLQTGEEKWLNRGDDVFAGGVELAWLGRAKGFNQNYRSSFDFVEWRAEAIEKHGAQ